MRPGFWLYPGGAGVHVLPQQHTSEADLPQEQQQLRVTGARVRAISDRLVAHLAYKSCLVSQDLPVVSHQLSCRTLDIREGT